jgi:hypothetical protein
MEIGRTLPVAGLEQVAAAWADSPVAGDASVEAENAPPPEPGQSASHSVESAGMQTVARAPNPVNEVRNTDDVLPTSMSVDSEFTAPAALLVPATLIGLQVEAAAAWPMQGRGFDPAPPRVERDSEREPPPPPVEENDDEEPEDAAPQSSDDEAEPAQVLIEEPLATAWSEPLTRTLRSALASRVPPQALLAAADQWKRGRCVVLACPQGHDAAGPAWAFVLWPRPQARRTVDGVAPPLELYGLQVEARLQWSAPPRRGQWCHVRVVKEHHPRTGRQLISLADAPAPRRPVPCEVQLGPVLARSLRWCEVCVRIQAAQRFWNALGAQWSVHVVVSAEPLIAPPQPVHGSSSC